MSYDIYLRDRTTGEVLVLEEPHEFKGGTHAVGGTRELWLSVTYNYGRHFRRVLGEAGIRALYGKTGAESVPVLETAIAELGDDVDADYWAPTEGNAKAALRDLMAMARLRPEGVWHGD